MRDGFKRNSAPVLFPLMGWDFYTPCLKTMWAGETTPLYFPGIMHLVLKSDSWPCFSILHWAETTFKRTSSHWCDKTWCCVCVWCQNHLYAEEAFWTDRFHVWNIGASLFLLLNFASFPHFCLHFLLPTEFPLHPQILSALHPDSWFYMKGWRDVCVCLAYWVLCVVFSPLIGVWSHQQNPSGIPEEEKCEPALFIFTAAFGLNVVNECKSSQTVKNYWPALIIHEVINKVMGVSVNKTLIFSMFPLTRTQLSLRRRSAASTSRANCRISNRRSRNMTKSWSGMTALVKRTVRRLYPVNTTDHKDCRRQNSIFNHKLKPS